MRNFYSVLAVLLPALLGGLRHHTVGHDTGGYGMLHFVSAVRASSFSEFLLCDGKLSRELGWAVLTYVSSKIFEHLNWNLFFYQLITLTCIYIALFKHRKITPVYFSWFIYLLVMNNLLIPAMRQGIAASIIFLGLDKLESKQYKKFFIYVLIATLFHSSAFVSVFFFMLLHYYIDSIKFSKHNKILLYAPLFVLPFVRYLLITIVPFIPFLSIYSEFGKTYSSSGLGKIAFLVGEVIMFELYSRGAHRVFSEGDMDNFWKFSVIFNLLYRLFVTILAVRVLFYFDLINVMLLASLPFFVKEKNLRIIVMFAVVSISLLYFILAYVTIGRGALGTWPYRSVFD